jgi:glycosyltransferase involved in cell wall biosynthesis
MERRKGPHVLVEAAIELLARRRREDVCFLLCGNKEGESLEYERAYEGMGIDSFIKFGGYRSDLKEIYQSCFCGVVPSSGWDSFPRTSLELAACGLPVIVSRIGGLPEAIVEGKTGLLFDPGNVKQLADRIETLLDNPKLAKEYGEKGRERCVSDLNLANQLNRLMIAIRRHIH